jgi:hypothetical protein
MRRLPQNQIKMSLDSDGMHVIASLYEHEGYRFWDKYRLSDLPNDFISLNDLKRFGIDIIDMKTCRSG